MELGELDDDSIGMYEQVSVIYPVAAISPSQVTLPHTSSPYTSSRSMTPAVAECPLHRKPAGIPPEEEYTTTCISEAYQ